MISHFEMIGLMILVGWNLWGGVYTIPVNVAVFGWAIVLEYKTTMVFWMFVLIYGSTVLLMKQLVNVLGDNSVFEFVFYFHAYDYLYEFWVIVVCVLEMMLIHLGGIRHKSYSERESIYDAFYRNALNRAAVGINQLQ